MEEYHLDPIQFGRLIQAVETLTREIHVLRTDMEDVKRGKNLLYGAMIVAGGVGAAIIEGLRLVFR